MSIAKLIICRSRKEFFFVRNVARLTVPAVEVEIHFFEISEPPRAFVIMCFSIFHIRADLSSKSVCSLAMCLPHCCITGASDFAKFLVFGVIECLDQLGQDDVTHMH